MKPVHYLIKHEEVLSHQKRYSHPILADNGTDQVSIRNNDRGNDIVVKLLNSFSFKSVTLFQTKFKTPTKKNKTPAKHRDIFSDTLIAKKVWRRRGSNPRPTDWETKIKHQPGFEPTTSCLPTVPW